MSKNIKLHVFHVTKSNGIINLACATCVLYANSIPNHCGHIMNLELKGNNHIQWFVHIRNTNLQK
jgi:hypothetical protein